MANILLTETCVRECPYCFAKKKMDESPGDYLSWDNMIYILDFLENSGEKRVSLLGGEPTLHPEFTGLTVYALERGFQVNVFTSGIMNSKKMDEIDRFLRFIPREKFSFTCNLNHPDLSTQTELEKIDQFLNRFGRLTTLGYNIFQEDFRLDFLLRKINEFSLNRHVRIGLTHPIPGEKNRFVPIEKMNRMAKRFMEHAPLFERAHVTPSFDCGMPLCIFSDEDLGRLYRITKNRLGFGCGPAIDIGPDMTVWSCFPMSGLSRKSLFDFNNLQEVHHYYQSMLERVRTETGGIFESCDQCEHRADGVCMGGCLAHFVGHYLTDNGWPPLLNLNPEMSDHEP